MSEIQTFRQCQNSNTSQFGFQHVQISDIWDYWDTHKTLGFQRIECQTVSEIQTLECVPFASKWLATGFFGFVLTLPHLTSLNK